MTCVLTTHKQGLITSAIFSTIAIAQDLITSAIFSTITIAWR